MISVFGLAGGPLLGVIVMGMFFPCVNGAVSCFKKYIQIKIKLSFTLKYSKSKKNVKSI